jgi:hypothetical protein
MHDDSRYCTFLRSAVFILVATARKDYESFELNIKERVDKVALPF